MHCIWILFTRICFVFTLTPLEKVKKIVCFFDVMWRQNVTSCVKSEVYMTSGSKVMAHYEIFHKNGDIDLDLNPIFTKTWWNVYNKPLLHCIWILFTRICFVFTLTPLAPRQNKNKANMYINVHGLAVKVHLLYPRIKESMILCFYFRRHCHCSLWLYAL